MSEHETAIAAEGSWVHAAAEDAIALARKLHHLASADPEKDGLLTSPEHDEKYGLERAGASRALWDASHPGDPYNGKGPQETADASPLPDDADAPAVSAALPAPPVEQPPAEPVAAE